MLAFRVDVVIAHDRGRGGAFDDKLLELDLAYAPEERREGLHEGVTAASLQPPAGVGEDDVLRKVLLPAVIAPGEPIVEAPNDISSLHQASAYSVGSPGPAQAAATRRRNSRSVGLSIALE